MKPLFYFLKLKMAGGYNQGTMIINYDEQLTPEQCDALQKRGWKIVTCHEDENARKCCEHYENKLFLGTYLGMSASKEFSHPKEAMFEIEEILSADVIQNTDHDGASIHTFSWENPNWNGLEYDWQALNPVPYTEEWRRMMVVSGWDCAVVMYDAPKTARETAVELQKLRSQIGQ